MPPQARGKDTLTRSKLGKTGQRVKIPTHLTASQSTTATHSTAVLIEYINGIRQRSGQSFERWTVVFDNDSNNEQVETAIILPDYLVNESK